MWLTLFNIPSIRRKDIAYITCVPIPIYEVLKRMCELSGTFSTTHRDDDDDDNHPVLDHWKTAFCMTHEPLLVHRETLRSLTQFLAIPRHEVEQGKFV